VMSRMSPSPLVLRLIFSVTTIDLAPPHVNWDVTIAPSLRYSQ
jgi:hypothetical protein